MPENSKPSPLLSLPTEIRLKIYEELFVSSEAVKLNEKKPLNLSGQVLQVCRQIHNEAISILYGENTFNVSITPLISLHRRLGEFKWELVRRFEVHVHAEREESFELAARKFEIGGRRSHGLEFMWNLDVFTVEFSYRLHGWGVNTEADRKRLAQCFRCIVEKWTGTDAKDITVRMALERQGWPKIQIYRVSIPNELIEGVSLVHERRPRVAALTYQQETVLLPEEGLLQSNASI